MIVEFIDTNVLVHGADLGAGPKFHTAVDLIARLADERVGAISTQVLVEFYNIAVRKLRMTSEQAEETIRDFASWVIHRPTHTDIIDAIRLQRRHRMSWWDATIVNSAKESGAHVLWSEDFEDGRKFGSLVVRNPFA
jgi:predicted nucleic acid-binding protein